jgi:hypothetical protein
MTLNIGKRFEKIVWDETYGCMGSDFLYRHHFKDSGAAGTDKTNQAPSDFLFSWRGNAYLVECKASGSQTSLKSCFSDMVKNHQVASLHTWLLSGGYGLVLFYSELTGLCEAWPAKAVIEARQEGKQLDIKDAYVFPIKELRVKFRNCLELA